jgi:UDPglucose 6-dehydrogenase
MKGPGAPLAPTFGLSSPHTSLATVKADIAVVEFDALDLDVLKDCMRSDVLVDLRNIFLPSQARAAGFSYTSIGR